jgi:hypothetical protein
LSLDMFRTRRAISLSWGTIERDNEVNRQAITV